MLTCTYPKARLAYLDKQIHNLWQRDEQPGPLPPLKFLLPLCIFSILLCTAVALKSRSSILYSLKIFHNIRRTPSDCYRLPSSVKQTTGFMSGRRDMQRVENNMYLHCARCQLICIFIFILGGGCVWGLLYMWDGCVRRERAHCFIKAWPGTDTFNPFVNHLFITLCHLLTGMLPPPLEVSSDN